MNTQLTAANFLNEWKPGAEIGIVIDDITKQDRTNLQINEMLTRIQELAKTYGFDFKMWGLRESFEQSLNKTLAKDKAALLDLVRESYAASYTTNTGFIMKIDADDKVGHDMQNALIAHNILLKDPSSGEITYNKGGSNG